MATVLVTDGEQRAALAVVRSLGKAGHTLVVCSSRGRSLAGASRYCVQEVRVPDPLGDPHAFLTAVDEAIARYRVDTLIPISEPSLLAILPERERLKGVHIPFPSLDSFVRICDKAAVANAAREVGIRVPEQHVLDSPEGAEELLATGRFPLVLKPSRSVVREGDARAKLSVIHVDGPDALRAAIRELPAAAYPVLAQERIVGPGVGVFVLIRNGKLRAAFSHTRIREKPPSGGVSVLRESAPLDPELLQRCLALLRRFQWEGVAMVECKLSEASGIPYIMEINGRFWGSLQLPIDAGVDFPRLLLEENGSEHPVTSYEVGVRSRWEWGDVDHLLARLRRTPEELALPVGSAGRARAALDFVRAFAPRNRPEVLRLSDPRPFLRESLDWFRRS